MFSRLFSTRTMAVAWILGLVISLLPTAVALADGAGTIYPK